ncbi:chemotaxis protein CheV [Vibrio sp. VB16]|uniref:chemotaxis protein CheV n=1 Tax=Vibrio sp. VB16 TaxID=2785746 RepID=UPI00189FFCDE|nr:chemotaxis protein CheV [Vibrio sp. VB16]UGA53750.1 chemotaxis protein CheV [Vibrio sp. VB16]
MSNSNILMESGTNELEIAEFRLIRELPDGGTKVNSYGINVAKVREIIRFPEMTDYPKGDKHIVGVFKSREKVTPLIHLAKWLGISEKQPTSDQYVIVTDFNGVTNGFLIDSINRIHRVSWSDLEAAGEISLAGEDNCIVASVNIEDRLVFILDFELIIAEMNSDINMSQYNINTDNNVDLSPEKKRRRAQHTILIADDSKFILEQLKTVVSESGYMVETATDGEQALNYYEANKQSISAIVSDVEMPKVDGLFLCRTITSQPNHPPVLIFSSTMTKENKLKAFEVGATETLTKPEIHKLIPLLDELIFPNG